MSHGLYRFLALSTLAVVLLAGAALAQAPTNDATRIFLTDIGDRFAALSSWRGTNYCDGSWVGISCNSNGDVTVNLSGRGLEGTLPSLNPVGSAVRVVSIDMSNNPRLHGRFPSFWAGLSNLRYLDLSSTSLDHNIPDSWVGMRKLETVRIANTYACGGLPNWNQDSLRTIDFSNNKMGGALAYSWSTMDNLQSVNIAGNPLCGCKPLTWTSAVLEAAAPDTSLGTKCLTAVPCTLSAITNCPVNDALVHSTSANSIGNWTTQASASPFDFVSGGLSAVTVAVALVAMLVSSVY